jgi:hypothetical protein
MAGVIKTFGIITFSLIVMFLIMNFNYQIMMEDDIRETTKTTQLTTIEDNINLGDLFVNNVLSINTERAENQWYEYFEKNSDTNYYYKVEIISVHQEPPGIAVRIRGYTDINMSEDQLKIDYGSVVIADDKE